MIGCWPPGEAHSVREFVELAFAEIGCDIVWFGRVWRRRESIGATGRVLVEIDPRYFRPLEVDRLLGIRQGARALGWRHGVSFTELVKEMVAADIEQVRREHLAGGPLVTQAE